MKKSIEFLSPDAATSVTGGLIIYPMLWLASLFAEEDDNCGSDGSGSVGAGGGGGGTGGW